jgi:hypothetical protein
MYEESFRGDVAEFEDGLVGGLDLLDLAEVVGQFIDTLVEFFEGFEEVGFRGSRLESRGVVAQEQLKLFEQQVSNR